MTTISFAKEKWARKMRDAGPRWKKGVTDKKEAYRKGLQAFNPDGKVGETMPKHWAEGVEKVTPEYFAAAVAPDVKKEVWASKLAEAIAS
jgi:hypothetical protein